MRRVSTKAVVVGVLIVGTLGGGLAWTLRRRRSDDPSATAESGASERDHPTSVGR